VNGKVLMVAVFGNPFTTLLSVTTTDLRVLLASGVVVGALWAVRAV